ncbi:tyrosine-type recombinase/integrase [Agrobacterium tumefaciens]|uniref:tyrosine-type recombinase/integrase n=1 Tax=Agrobacterium tumefaciens TaxID=358 RepID=UPI0022A922C1
MRAWIAVRPEDGETALFLNNASRMMTRSGFEYNLEKHAAAVSVAPTLATKSISPHVLRHSCAMHMLQATRDICKVALWLGHVTLQSTEIYLRADPTEILDIPDALAPLGIKPGKFRPPDKLIAMLATRQRIVMWSRWMAKSRPMRPTYFPWRNSLSLVHGNSITDRAAAANVGPEHRLLSFHSVKRKSARPKNDVR